MFLPKNLKFSNKYYFVNFLRYIFSNYDFILFFNILKNINSYFFPVRVLRYTTSLEVCLFNSTIVSAVVKKNVNVHFLPGTHLVLYTNNLKDIIDFIYKSKAEYPNFLPFALLFKRYFIALDSVSLANFLMWEKKANFFFIIYILMYVNLMVLGHFFSLFSNLFLLGTKYSPFLIKVKS